MSADGGGSTTHRLSDEHLAQLRASGLSDETIARAGLYTERDPRVLAKLLGKTYSVSCGAAIVFPITRPGDSQPHSYRVRPDRPRSAKYDQSPKKWLIYFPPRGRAQDWYADISKPLYWTEGEKKSLALDQLGLPCVGLTGVNMWHDKAHRDATGEWRLHPTITDHVAIAGRKHVIVFDADARTNDNVMQAARQLSGVLRAAGALETRFICPPAGGPKGIDDYLGACGGEATLRLLAAAEPIEPLFASAKADRPDSLEPLFAEDLPKGVALGTELGLAHLLRAHHGADLLHCGELGWLAWDGRRYASDATGEASRRLQNVGRRIELGAAELYRCAAKAVGDAETKRLRARADELRKWAQRAQTASGVRRALELAQTLLPVRVEELDRDPFLLNVLGGTIELTTGTLREHRRDDKLTKLAPVEYQPGARSELWEQFLARILPDDEVRRFVQRYLGYACTGSVAEQCFVLAIGDGANGKSVLAETVRHVLGDYSRDTPSDTLMQTKQPRGTENDLARLRGARFVTVKEIGEGKRLDESRVKSLTGADTTTARFLFREFFEFQPTFKFWVYANHLPVIKNTDNGIWRRIMLVRFSLTIPHAERDSNLLSKLKAEAPGVLAWLVRGCASWHEAGGLHPPDAVRAATSEWRDEANNVAEFIRECCVTGSFAQVGAGALYEAYATWERSLGNQHALPANLFSSRVRALGYEACRSGSRGRYWRGLGLLAGAAANGSGEAHDAFGADQRGLS